MGNSLLTQDFFSLFGLPRSYDLALDHLESAWKRLQAVVHPDRFAGAGDAQRRMALQWSTRINEGHQTLKDPISRATYLLALNGLDLQAESNTSMPTEFLMTQMAWREALEELHDQSDAQGRAQDKASLRQEVDQFWQSGEERLVSLLSGAADSQALNEAADLVRQLMFVKKFEQELLEA